MKKIGKILQIINGLKETKEIMSFLISLYYRDSQFSTYMKENLNNEQLRAFINTESSIIEACDLIEERLKNQEIEF